MFPDGTDIARTLVLEGACQLPVAMLRDILQLGKNSVDAPVQVDLQFTQSRCADKCFNEVRVASFAIARLQTLSDLELELRLPQDNGVVRGVLRVLAYVFRRASRYRVCALGWQHVKSLDPPEIDERAGKVVFVVPEKNAQDFPMVAVVYRKPMAVARRRVVAALIAFAAAVAAALAATPLRALFLRLFD